MKFTYFSDVSLHPEVNELGACVQESIRGGISQLVANANAWKKFKLLWRMQRVTAHTRHMIVLLALA